MRVVAVGVQEAHCDRFHGLAIQSSGRAPHGPGVQRPVNRTVG